MKSSACVEERGAKRGEHLDSLLQCPSSGCPTYIYYVMNHSLFPGKHGFTYSLSLDKLYVEHLPMALDQLTSFEKSHNYPCCIWPNDQPLNAVSPSTSTTCQPFDAFSHAHRCRYRAFNTIRHARTRGIYELLLTSRELPRQ